MDRDTRPSPRPARLALKKTSILAALIVLVPAAGAIVLSGPNAAPSPTSVAVGGTGNTVLSLMACDVAGDVNTVMGDWSCIGAGQGNAIGPNMPPLATRSFIGAGQQNQLDGPSGFIGSGLANRIGGVGNAPVAAFLGGGQANVIAGAGANDPQSAVLAGGQFNTVIGNVGAIGGGESNTVNTAMGTIPGGEDATTSSYGELAHGSGGFNGVPGTAQHGTYIARYVTHGIVLNQPLFLDQVAERMVVPPGATWAFEARIAAADANGVSAGWVLRGVIENRVGIPALVPALPGFIPGVPIGLDIPPNVWLTQAVATPVGLEIQVTSLGLGTAPVRWVAVIETTELVFP